MDPNQILSQLSLTSDAVAILIVTVALFLILLLNRRRILVRIHDWRIRRCLDRIGSEQIRNLVCADGLDGYYMLDRLALTADAILLISYKPYGGNIYCAEQISEWTQVVGQKSFKFENPLFELENQLTALRMVVGNVPLRGYLFFNLSAQFPKGHPDSVMKPDSIPAGFLPGEDAGASAEILSAWETLKTLRRQASENRGVGVKT